MKDMNKLAMRTILAVVSAVVPLLVPLPMAHAAVGDVVGSVSFDRACTSGAGVGIAFDGTNLWYSCAHSHWDLHRAGTDGVVTASYSIDAGLGALAYDAGRNGIWAGPGFGRAGAGAVWFISLDAGKNVVGFSLVGNVPEAGILDDGLAYDGLIDDLYFSTDGSVTISHYDIVPGSPPTVGAHLDDFAWGGSDCFNSGLAIGGTLLYEGSNGCNHVWVVDKVSKLPAFDFPTIIGAIRDEDLECDEITFAGIGKEVMWSIEAYEPRQAGAYEIPAGSCKHGGGGSGGGGGGGGSAGRMTGGGKVGTGGVWHGLELHCDATVSPNHLEVNWAGNNKFRLESLDFAACSDDPSFGGNPPAAGFDTYVGTGTGRYNGVSGYTIEFRFTDAGEPAGSDTAEITIFRPNGSVLMTVSGPINGNQQAFAQ